MRLLLTLDDIEKSLHSLPGWKREGAELVKTYRFASYLTGIEFVRLLGTAAEAANHHPDLAVGWRKVTVKLTTHSEGGITSLDVEMAQNAERLSKAAEETASPK
ncbi:4a-hydroxytetrahydrobiopterin dehydratase [Prosthecobacter debontii]|uniref:Putative pterin-4-alpha-carbinolamine dehydratase n=1 Tax=Prosthecobacter debontii TaxID=48467 RepID=A0A1T4YAE4_9BACT|nr:4a-hydroxytetrahydrobiopterin dehydratase [Prosthecobacter debontii]SKA98498.1 4a-hydroxytetrahydrobiopterin dehydratase [Prosthecobacter debontii]